MVLKIHVVYCGAWGYKPKFDKLKAQLIDEFGEGEFEMTGEGTPGATGFFEVTVDGDLIHSKKNGDGYVDSEPKLNKIYQAIEAKKGWLMKCLWREKGWNESPSPLSHLVDSAIGVLKSHSPPTRDEGGQKRSEDADPLLMVGEKTPKIGGEWWIRRS